MIFRIDNEFRIEGNGNYFDLIYEEDTGKINPKTKKPVISRDVWHYSSFKMCLESYLDKCLIGENSVSANDILNKYKEAMKIIKSIKEIKTR